MADLPEQHAAPNGEAPRLTEEQIEQLKKRVPGWSVTDGRLTRDVTVKNFREALKLVNALGEIAEVENHHPDLLIHRWNHVRIELYTHTAEGLSENDFILAAKFSEAIPKS